MVSLFDLAEIKEEGVYFQSPVDGSQLLLTPELSIKYQNEIGADIMMCLDDVCSSLTTDMGRVEVLSHNHTLRKINYFNPKHSVLGGNASHNSVVGPLHQSPLPAEGAEPVRHRAGRPGPEAASRVFRGADRPRHPGLCHWRPRGGRGQSLLLESSASVHLRTASRQAKVNRDFFLG